MGKHWNHHYNQQGYVLPSVGCTPSVNTHGVNHQTCVSPLDGHIGSVDRRPHDTHGGNNHNPLGPCLVLLALDQTRRVIVTQACTWAKIIRDQQGIETIWIAI